MNRFRLAIAGVTVTALAMIGVGLAAVTGPAQAADLPFAYDYYPGNPNRVITNQAIAANTDTSILIASGVANISCYKAAELNFTYAFPVGGDGWLAAWGTGAYQGTSLVSTQLGKASSNAGTIPVYASGSNLYVKVRASRAGNVSVDVHGYFINC